MNFDYQSENTLHFSILYGTEELSLKLLFYDIVSDLKQRIYEEYNIPPSKQILDCWQKTPEDDNEVLGNCCSSDTNYLVLYLDDNMEVSTNESKNLNLPQEGKRSLKGLELSAAVDFIEYFSSNYNDRGMLFHVCRLEDAISQACFTSLNSRKVLLLFLHNKNDKFAKIFAEHLTRDEVREIVNDSFFLLGWDLENSQYHEGLIEALNKRAELSLFIDFIKSKICAAILIVPVKNSFVLFSCLRTDISKKDFLETLNKAKEFLRTENEIERDLDTVEHSENDIGSVNYQQIMLDLLGDRDYDSFDYFEFDLLKRKIGYALYGPPKKEDGYDPKEKKKINFLFNVIRKENNAFTKWKDRIVISFIYNCTEPLPSEKQSRAKKYKDYNPNTDLNPLPIFVLRKCKNSENPCRIFIDDNGRVYETWNNYLTMNKLPKCEMILPLNGRFQVDENGKVILERHLSPACGIGAKILQGVDIASTAVGLASGGVFIAAAIPTLTVAPVALVVAGATGLGVGLYSLGRSAYTLYDRSKHKETLSFVNSEARGAYLNIVAGSLGFVGAGANMAVSQLAARGFNIGQGATAAVNVINVANLGASGVSVVNSGYDVFDQWWNENQTPTLLTIVQLSSSILFFGHAVYNFKSASVLVEESQTKTLRDYQDSLRSNRHRKTFNKLMKETIRQNNGNVNRGRAEVIKTVINIQNKDEVFASLTRLNKQMNKNGVRFSADSGQIKLNGVSIDMSRFSSMDSNEAATFLTTLPNNPEPTPNQVTSINSQLENSFKGINLNEITHLGFSLAKIFINTEESIKDKIINAVAAIVMKLMTDHPGYYRQIDEMFPGIDKFMRLFTMVNGYFQNLINNLEDSYQKWLATKDPEFEEPIFPKLALEYSKRVLTLFNFATKAYFYGNTLTESGLKELINYFYTWFTKQILEYEETMKRKQERVIHSGTPNRQQRCSVCGGVYYH